MAIIDYLFAVALCFLSQVNLAHSLHLYLLRGCYLVLSYSVQAKMNEMGVSYYFKDGFQTKYLSNTDGLQV